MTQNTDLVKYETPRGEITLSHEAVRALCPKATAGEIALFLRVCLYHRLNPFLREVYLVKYDERAPASIVIGKDTFTQRAEAHPAFKGFKAGLILERDGNVLEVAGSFMGARDTLLGGWAEIYRSDRDHPFRITVGIQEYNRNQSSWRSMPATMIRKVALVQALREAFPSLFAGLYDGSITDTSDALEGEIQETGAAPETQPQEPPPGQDQPTLQSKMPKQTPSLGSSPVPQGAAPKPEVKSMGEVMEWARQHKKMTEDVLAVLRDAGYTAADRTPLRSIIQVPDARHPTSSSPAPAEVMALCMIAWDISDPRMAGLV